MAEGGQSAEIVARLNETLECSICMGQYTDPRILDCVHSFCLKCIKAHVGDSLVIRCPLCNAESPTPSIGVEGLKSNFFIRGLIEDVICRKADDSVDTPKSNHKICGSCEEGNIATSHCDDCECELCADCVQLHGKLKVLRTHQVIPYITAEEIQAQLEVEVTTRVSHLNADIGVALSDLQANIDRVKGQMGEINKHRHATLSQVQVSQQKIVHMVKQYVTELNSVINENADKRLGDLPDQLKNYEKQLGAYNTLQKQAAFIHDLELERKLKLSKELQSQLEEYKNKSREMCVASFRNKGVRPAEFVAGALEDVYTVETVESVIRCGIGFMTPLKSRAERSVKIRTSDMSRTMQDFAVQCAHDALDVYIMNPETETNMLHIGGHIFKNFNKMYSRGVWTCCVFKGFLACYQHNKNIISFEVDDLGFLISQAQD